MGWLPITDLKSLKDVLGCCVGNHAGVASPPAAAASADLAIVGLCAAVPSVAAL